MNSSKRGTEMTSRRVLCVDHQQPGRAPLDLRSFASGISAMAWQVKTSESGWPDEDPGVVQRWRGGRVDRLAWM